MQLFDQLIICMSSQHNRIALKCGQGNGNSFSFSFSVRPLSAFQLQTAAAGWSFYRTNGKDRIIRNWKWNVVDVFFTFLFCIANGFGFKVAIYLYHQ
jgi:hypothetical protein